MSKHESPLDRLAKDAEESTHAAKKAEDSIGGLNNDLNKIGHSFGDLGRAKSGKDLSKDVGNMASGANDLANSPMGQAIHDAMNDDPNQDQEHQGQDSNGLPNHVDDDDEATNNMADLAKDFAGSSLAKNPLNKNGLKGTDDALKSLNNAKDPGKALNEALKNRQAGSPLASMADDFNNDRDVKGRSHHPGDEQPNGFGNNTLPNGQPNLLMDEDNQQTPKGLGDLIKDKLRNLKNAAKEGLKNGLGGLVHGTSGFISSSVKSVTGKAISVKAATIAAVSSLSAPVVIGGTLLGGSYLNYNNYQQPYDAMECATQNQGGMGFADALSSLIKGANGDWTKPNTVGYKTAHGIFMSWVHQGCSGAAAAGIVGYITGEGGDFSIPDRAEGHYGDTEEGNGIAYGAVPIPSGNYRVGGGGIYQLTPYSDFAPLNDKKWLNVGEQTKFFIQNKHIKGSGWNRAYDFSGKAPTFRDFAHLSDPEDACKAWDAAEIGNPNNMSGRIANAKKAYQLFDGAKYQANDSLLGDGSTASANDNSAAAEKANAQNCAQGGGHAGVATANGIAGYAQKMIGWFHYSQTQRTDFAKDGNWKGVKSLDQVKKDGHVDCTSFAWLCGRLAGYRLNGDSWPFTTMAVYGKSDGELAQEGLKEVPANEAKAGDFAMNSEHGVVLVSDYKGASTMVCDDGYDDVKKHTIQQAFMGTPGWQQAKYYRATTKR